MNAVGLKFLERRLCQRVRSAVCARPAANPFLGPDPTTTLCGRQAKAYLYKSWKVHRSSRYKLPRWNFSSNSTRLRADRLYFTMGNPTTRRGGVLDGPHPDPHLTQCSMAHTSPCAKHPAGRIMPHHDYTNLLEWLQQSLRDSREHRISRLI